MNTELLQEMLISKQKRLGLIGKEIAKEIGIAVSTYSRATLNGGKPNFDNLQRMADWLQVPVETFMRDIIPIKSDKPSIAAIEAAIDNDKVISKEAKEFLKDFMRTNYAKWSEAPLC